MPSNHQPPVVPLLALAASLAVALGVAPAAQAKDAAFKVTMKFEETVQSTTTSTESGACRAPVTASQTVRFSTTKAQPLTANIVDAGSSQGLVELGPSGSGYAQIPGVVGTIERHADISPSPCSGIPPEPQDCGTRSPRHWEVIVQPRSTRTRGREHLQGLAVYGAPVGPDPFSSCTPPATPLPAIADVAKIDPRTLFDKHRRTIVLHISGTIPWRSDDREGRTATQGTYSHTITLTLRRTG